MTLPEVAVGLEEAENEPHDSQLAVKQLVDISIASQPRFLPVAREPGATVRDDAC